MAFKMILQFRFEQCRRLGGWFWLGSTTRK